MRLVALTVALFSSTSALACAMPRFDAAPALVDLMETVDEAKPVIAPAAPEAPVHVALQPSTVIPEAAAAPTKPVEPAPNAPGPFAGEAIALRPQAPHGVDADAQVRIDAPFIWNVRGSAGR